MTALLLVVAVLALLLAVVAFVKVAALGRAHRRELAAARQKFDQVALDLRHHLNTTADWHG